ncbi:MAG: HAMP domain-containing sensor histidine kinase [Planctomycetota bacterium]
MLRNVPVQQKGLLVLGLPVATATLVLAILYFIGRSLDRAGQLSLHSQHVLATIESIERELVAVHGENLQLALLGTSETAFEIRERADAVHAALAELGGAVGNDGRQAAAVTEFVPLVEHVLDSLAKTSDVLRTGMIAEGAAQSAANDRQLAEVSKMAAAMRHEERRIGLERLAEAGQFSQQRRIALIAGGLTILLGGLFLGWRLMQSMIRRMLVIKDNVRRLGSDDELAAPIPARDEIGQIDRAVHEMVRSLRAQKRDNEMFVYSVSHDLRSPLVNLQGFSKELERSARELGAIADGGDVDPAARRRVRQIVSEEMPEALGFIDLAVQRQARIIDSLLSLSRVGRVDYHWTDVDIGACARELAAQARNGQSERPFEIEVAALPPVYGDRDALERVFDNLLSNAIKFLDPSRPGRIEVGCDSQTEGSVVVYVRDNGVGIAGENIERVFVPFARFAGGLGEGIGLSLVRRVVDRHHGSIWIQSRLGSGTTVFMRLPAARGEHATAGDGSRGSQKDSP